MKKKVFFIIFNLVIIELFCQMVWYFIERHDYTKPFHLSGLYYDIELIRLYNEERKLWEDSVFDPYGLYRAKPNFTGKYFSTNQDGFRNTVQSLKATPVLKEKTILFFGGSTMFGSGTPGDGHTIPSLFARLLNKNDPAVNYRVENLGIGGYFSTQEMLLFLSLLTTKDIDIAIFYDWENEPTRGFEELNSPAKETLFISPHVPLSPLKKYMSTKFHNFGGKFFLFFDGCVQRLTNPYAGRVAMRVFKGIQNRICLLLRVQKKNLASFKSGIVNSNINTVALDREAKRIVKMYRKNKNIIDILSNAYNVKIFFFMQPNLYTKALQSDYERSIFESYVTVYPQQSYLYGKVYDLARNEFSHDHNFFDISGEINICETVYFDICHMQQKGNALVAKAIFNRLKMFLN